MMSSDTASWQPPYLVLYETLHVPGVNASSELRILLGQTMLQYFDSHSNRA